MSIIKSIDKQGRITLPVELLRHVGMDRHDLVEVDMIRYKDKQGIFIYRPPTDCSVCGRLIHPEKLVRYRYRNYCSDCIKALHERANSPEVTDDE